ncbi:MULTISPECIES: helix-turn-helix transcriptional regulator [unclassified Streptomyces]|uniref:ArsR/SmtB family transcription factor n=1 Tax=unclassified Streptomyces TaxID=2593676 RepID=UPI0013A564D1|nr:winged helix-turn-helix domain-containing protein [Streptomyces sp. CS065A]NYS21403.1 winged helix-turn-helix transcriptional regulator [Streptomyces sp. SJ1-7]
MGRFSELSLGPLETAPVSVVAQPGVTLMSLVADALGGRSQGVLPAWRRLLRSAVPEGAEAVLRPLFAREYSMVPDCLTPTAPLWETDLRVQLERLADVPPSQLSQELETDFGGTVPGQWQSVVDRPKAFIHAYAALLTTMWEAFGPIWARAGSLLDQETERVGVAVVSNALPSVLAGLGPKIRFAGETLYVPDPHPERFERGARRVVLVPIVSGYGASVFSFDRSDVVWFGYPVPGLNTLWTTRETTVEKDRLKLVVGALRAKILRELVSPRTMGSLAAASDCTPATVTYHCGHLQAAGLITRERLGQHVVARRTASGEALVTLLSG